MKLTYVTYPELTRAIAIAVEAHDGQTRRDGQPYITHPIAVMDAVETISQKILAILHDVVEDSDVTFQDLRDYGITQQHVEDVEALTRRKSESYIQFLARVKEASEDAQIVKEADMKHNLSDCKGMTPDEVEYAEHKYTKGLAYLRSNDG